MIQYSFWAKVIGSIRGHSVVAVCAIAGLVILARISLPDWLKLICIFIVALPIIASSFRAVRGTEEGSTDLVITPEMFNLSNIPQAVFSKTMEAIGLVALQTLTRSRHAMPRPAGIVRGNPAIDADLIVDSKATLPKNVEVVDQSPEPPADVAAIH